MRKLSKFIFGVLSGTMLMGMTAFAAEYTVTDAPAVLYTNGATVLCTDADNTTAVLPIAEAGLPIQVTGVTSNGYFRIKLGGQTFYVAGTGLSAETTTATAPTQTVTTPAEQGKKYNCVIEADDVKWLEYAGVGKNFTRQDYTDNDIYIYMRDQLETGLARTGNNWEVFNSFSTGKPWFKTTATWTGQRANVGNIACNLLIDMLKEYPNAFNINSDWDAIPEFTSMSKPFSDTGDRNVEYIVKLYIPQ